MTRAALIALLALFLLSEAAQSAEPTVTGTASWYGPGDGVATQWCTWMLRHTHGCGFAVITSLETGITVEVPVVDWCQCFRGTPQERIIDLQWGVVAALGLPRSQGLYPVRVEWVASIGPTTLPNTAMPDPLVASALLLALGLGLSLLGLALIVFAVRR